MFSPVAEIHLDRLVRNYEKVQAQVGDTQVMPVVKADGYGHGAVPVTQALEKAGASFFGVFTMEEALELRRAGVEGKILTFECLNGDVLESALKKDITLNVSWHDQIELLSDFAVSEGNCPKVHLKVDTGMTRLGVLMDEVEKILDEFKSRPEIRLEGIYSHYSTSDEGDKSYADLQTERFTRVATLAEAAGLKTKYFHISNSGSVLDMSQSYFNLVRVGMILYGAYPSDETPESINLEPVMNFMGPIVQLKRVKAGTPVSYGSDYAPDSDAYIAVVQAGFADGMPRNWFKKGYVGYRGRNYPIAGRVCMDQFMVNFGDDEPAIGDHVLIFGDDGESRILIEEIARATDLTPYVLMTAIGGRTRRIYVEG